MTQTRRDDATGVSDVPLCVDLDGTLVWNDTLVESILELCRTSPATAVRLPFWMLQGRTRLKDTIASRVVPDVSALHWNDALLEFLHAEHARGRTLVLVTAAHERIAMAVASHVPLFSLVMASTTERNLKSTVKARALVERFGSRGFDYIGDAISDIPVWQHARQVHVAGDDPPLEQRIVAAGLTITRRFGDGNTGLRSSVRRLIGHIG